MHQAVGATQLLVEGQLQSVFGAVDLTEEVANGTTGEGGEGLTTGIELFPMETALVGTFLEDGQHAHFTESVVVDTAWPDSPVTGTNRTVFQYFLFALEQVGLKFCSRLFGEDLIQTFADAVDLLFPD